MFGDGTEPEQAKKDPEKTGPGIVAKDYPGSEGLDLSRYMTDLKIWTGRPGGDQVEILGLEPPESPPIEPVFIEFELEGGTDEGLSELVRSIRLQEWARFRWVLEVIVHMDRIWRANGKRKGAEFMWDKAVKMASLVLNRAIGPR